MDGEKSREGDCWQLAELFVSGTVVVVIVLDFEERYITQALLGAPGLYR